MRGRCGWCAIVGHSCLLSQPILDADLHLPYRCRSVSCPIAREHKEHTAMPEITVDLRGKGVIVTGAGGSIGAACALALARCGASLALNDRDPQALERIVSRVRETGVPVISLLGDVSDYARVQQMAAQGIAELGNVFGLVNIAGTSMPKPILEMTREEW